MPPAPAGVRVEALARCPTAFYRFLYGEVGRAWQWWERLQWDDARLDAHLARPEVGIFVLYRDGVPAGYLELARHDDGATEIAYFGLMPHAIGGGLGRWFLEWGLAEAWRWHGRPTRVWLHTCSLDHPAALPNYLRRGFSVTRTERVAPPEAVGRPGGRAATEE